MTEFFKPTYDGGQTLYYLEDVQVLPRLEHLQAGVGCWSLSNLTKLSRRKCFRSLTLHIGEYDDHAKADDEYVKGSWSAFFAQTQWRHLVVRVEPRNSTPRLVRPMILALLEALEHRRTHLSTVCIQVGYLPELVRLPWDVHLLAPLRRALVSPHLKVINGLTSVFDASDLLSVLSTAAVFNTHLQYVDHKEDDEKTKLQLRANQVCHAFVHRFGCSLRLTMHRSVTCYTMVYGR